MESEILLVLKNIELALYWLIAIVVISAISNWVRTGVSIKNFMRRELGKVFETHAGVLYDKGELDALLSLCEKKLEGKPNHSKALWYKAKVLYRKQEYVEAKKVFESLAISEPVWDESFVQPHLKKIKDIESAND